MNNEQSMRYDADKKSLGAALAFWWLLGFFGGHRFYLGKTGTAILQLILTITVVGIVVNIVWLIVDVCMLSGMVRKYNNELISQIKLNGFGASHLAALSA